MALIELLEATKGPWTRATATRTATGHTTGGRVARLFGGAAAMMPARRVD